MKSNSSCANIRAGRADVRLPSLDPNDFLSGIAAAVWFRFQSKAPFEADPSGRYRMGYRKDAHHSMRTPWYALVMVSQ